MTHLKIEQNNIIERVSSSTIEGLYNVINNSNLDQQSNLSGELCTDVVYKEHADYITEQFPDLHITSDEYYIKFADDRIEEELREHMPNSSSTYRNYFQTHTGLTYDFVKLPNYFDRYWLADISTDIESFDEFPLFENVLSIQTGIFWGATKLRHLPLPQKAQSLGGWMFNDCTNLQEIDIPATVTEIGQSCFQGCSSLRYVICRAITPPTYNTAEHTSFDLRYSYPFYVPDESVSAYQTAWTDYSSRIKPLSQFATDFPNG